MKHINQAQATSPSAVNLYYRDDGAIVNSLMAALGMRDIETKGHSERVVRFSVLLGHELGLNMTEMKWLEEGALLHDIGKIGIPDAILQKPGRLTSQEWTTMREHPLLGFRILRGLSFLDQASLVVLQHHERWDGKGYPFGLRGTEINRNARIFAVADALDAMTSDRVYREGRTFAEAGEELRKRAGQQFDPEVIECFAAIPEGEWEPAQNGRSESAFGRGEDRFSYKLRQQSAH